MLTGININKKEEFMAAIITNKFRIHNQEQFVESFSETSPNVYYLG